MTSLTGEVTELLQQMIRNRCVNEGTPESGGESRNAGVLGDFLDGAGFDVERYEPLPGRTSIVARLEGSDPKAPSLLLMGHTDVVPVNDPSRWRHDPFGGELVDGEVWGRGAVDMLNTTTSMAVAARRLAASGFRPRGSLIYAGVADEEALGTHGAQWLVENQRDAVLADYVVTEFGGFRLPMPSAGGPKYPVMVAEKGTYWCTLRIRGTPGHASMPLRTDNAVVKAAEVVRRLAAFWPPTTLHETWRRFVESMELPAEVGEALLDPDKVRAFIESPADEGLARTVHACTHTTFAPTILHGGIKTNVIPDTADLQVDVRTLPGQTGDDIRALFAEALGDLWPAIEIVSDAESNATASPPDTPLFDSIRRVASKLVPGAGTVPFMIVGATDARFFRRAGSVAYGWGLMSERISFTEFRGMFHGDNEHVDQESLRLSAEMWEALARDFLG